MVRQFLSFLAVTALAACDAGLQSAAPAQGVSVRFPDVGQGHATVAVKGDTCALIDAGPPETPGDWMGALPCRSIAGVLVTHWDLDHRGGLAALLARFPVGHVWYGHLPQEDSVQARLDGFCRIAAKGCRQVRAGDRLDALEGLDWEILSTGPDSLPDGNETSVVSRLAFAGGSVLVAGDLDSAGEQRLALTMPARLRSDVLLLSHHGSGGSNSLQWLGTVRPRLAVVQCGRNNRYGHPASTTMERLQALRIPAWVTSDLGGLSGMLPATPRQGLD